MMPRKMSDPSTMPKKIMKSWQASEKGPGRQWKRVRAGTEKGRIRESLGKVEFGRVLENVESRQVLKRWNPGECWKKAESGRVPERWNSGKCQKCRIRASIREGLG